MSGMYWRMSSALLLTGALAAPGSPAFAAPKTDSYGCDDYAYMVEAPQQKDNSTFYTYKIRDNALTPVQALDRQVNAIGVDEYPTPGHIVGISPYRGGAPYGDGSHLVTISKAGVLADLGKVPTPDLNFSFLGTSAGDVYYVLSPSDKIYRIDVNDASPTYLKVLSSVALSRKPQIGDLDYNPVDKMLYGVDTDGTGPAKVVRINPTTGEVTDIAVAGSPKATPIYGAAFVSLDGILYAMHNGAPGGQSQSFMFTLNAPALGGGPVTGYPLGTGQHVTHNDGAACLTAEDFGDAPDSYGTLAASNGPRHVITDADKLTSWFAIGKVAVSNLDGVPGPEATGDNPYGVQDEDGLSGPVNLATTGATVTVPIANSAGRFGRLCGWLDLNGNGRFDDNERQTAAVAPGTTSATLTWPDTATDADATSYLRLRLFQDNPSKADPSPLGWVEGGEVEDYKIGWLPPAPNSPTVPGVPGVPAPGSPGNPQPGTPAAAPGVPAALPVGGGPVADRWAPDLPTTGRSLAPMLAAGLAMLILGGVAVAYSRRVRREPADLGDTGQ